MKNITLLITEFHEKYKKEGLSDEIVSEFQDIIWKNYQNHGRVFPFREKITDYNVLVSEIMLQQTQTGAVSEKFLKFIKKFPDFETLAKSSLDEVLRAWQGLGYNRRAIALKKIAEIIMKEHNGKLPESKKILLSFPQIGNATASSILTFAFNKPTIFVETNIRRVYIYFFFTNQYDINDKDILPLVEKTLDKKNPREWYYALMDYGVMLKKTHPELNKRSVHYKKQKPFKGSDREIRGNILKILLNHSSIPKSSLFKRLKNDKGKIRKILNDLEKEGFLKQDEKIVYVKK